VSIKSFFPGLGIKQRAAEKRSDIPIRYDANQLLVFDHGNLTDPVFRHYFIGLTASSEEFTVNGSFVITSTTFIQLYLFRLY